jgi:hypothetical protein
MEACVPSFPGEPEMIRKIFDFMSYGPRRFVEFQQCLWIPPSNTIHPVPKGRFLWLELLAASKCQPPIAIVKLMSILA